MLSDYQTLVPSLVLDSSSLITDEAVDAALGLALTRYSEDRPQTARVDITGDGTKLLDLPEGWQAGFSRLVSIEYPVGQVPPNFLKGGYGLYDAPAGQKLMFAAAPAATKPVRVAFTKPHELTDEVDTIPLRDREAVANWALAVLLQSLANHYSGSGTPSIQADTVDWQQKGNSFAARAREARQFYFNHMGIDPKKNSAAGAVVNLDRTNSLGGDRLIHRNSLR